jgi:hypothetical protein
MNFHCPIHTNQPQDPTESHLYTLLIVRQFLTSFFYGRLSLQFCMHFSSSHARQTLGTSHPPRFHNLEGIRSRVQITSSSLIGSPYAFRQIVSPRSSLGVTDEWIPVGGELFSCCTSLALYFFVKRHANFGRYWQTFLAPFTHRFPFDR